MNEASASTGGCSMKARHGPEILQNGQNKNSVGQQQTDGESKSHKELAKDVGGPANGFGDTQKVAVEAETETAEQDVGDQGETATPPTETNQQSALARASSEFDIPPFGDGEADHEDDEALLEKLTEARAKLFREHAETLNSNVSQSNGQDEFGAALNDMPLPSGLASRSGRALWSLDGLEADSRNKKRVVDVPALLAKLTDQDRTIHTKPELRKSYEAMSVGELEQSILSKRDRDDTSPDSANGAVEEAPTNGNHSKKKAYTLLFNECSVSCVSRWVSNQINQGRTAAGAAINGSTAMATTSARSSKGKDSPCSNTVTTQQRTRCHLATVTSRFRRCSFCNKFGHYESECPEQTPQQTMLLGDDNDQAQQQKRPGHRKRRRPWEKAEENKAVVVEMSNGYMVEQRESPFVEPATSGVAQTAPQHVVDTDDSVEVTEVDGFFIRASTDGPSTSPPVRVDRGELAGWSSPRGNGEICVGVAVSGEPDDSAKLSLRCIAVLSPEAKARKSNSSNNPRRDTVGETPNIPVAQLFPVADVAKAVGEASSAATTTTTTGVGAVAKAASKPNGNARLKDPPARPKDPPTQRHGRKARDSGAGVWK